MSDRILAEMTAAEHKAWDSLARYKFWMFGYHAAQWVLLNRCLDQRQSNPFSSLVSAARAHMAREHGQEPLTLVGDEEGATR